MYVPTYKSFIILILLTICCYIFKYKLNIILMHLSLFLLCTWLKGLFLFNIDIATTCFLQDLDPFYTYFLYNRKQIDFVYNIVWYILYVLKWKPEDIYWVLSILRFATQDVYFTKLYNMERISALKLTSCSRIKKKTNKLVDKPLVSKLDSRCFNNYLSAQKVTFSSFFWKTCFWLISLVQCIIRGKNQYLLVNPSILLMHSWNYLIWLSGI